jgi:hypothetical protein
VSFLKYVILEENRCLYYLPEELDAGFAPDLIDDRSQLLQELSQLGDFHRVPSLRTFFVSKAFRHIAIDYVAMAIKRLGSGKKMVNPSSFLCR